MAGFIANVDKDIPWHLSAFHPMYKLADAVPTPLSALERGRTLGLEAGLRHIYLGNVNERSATRCTKCQAALIERAGFRVVSNRLSEGRCPECATSIKGIWN